MVALFVWPPGAAEDQLPTVARTDLGDERFIADGQRFVLAFLPEGSIPDQPPSVPMLPASQAD